MLRKLLILFLCTLMIVSIAKADAIVRKPEPMDMADYPDQLSLEKALQYDDSWGYDFRGLNVSEESSAEMDQLISSATFDDRTVWPFELREKARKTMTLGKDPGLNVRKLHDLGLTGKGVGIGIIDDVLLVDHVEYVDRVIVYEELNVSLIDASMHGGAVASLAVGKNTGVAPDADLYYIASNCGTWTEDGMSFEIDYSYTAEAIDRLVEINRSLPDEQKICVISISKGWGNNEKGYGRLMLAIHNAKLEGIETIGTMPTGSKIVLWGLRREALNDPNQLASYEPSTIPVAFFEDNVGKESDSALKYLMVPMEGRTMAAPTGRDEYIYSATGGSSYIVPYVAGLYAIACQCDPNITLEQFMEFLFDTGTEKSIPQIPASDSVAVNPYRIIDLYHTK